MIPKSWNRLSETAVPKCKKTWPRAVQSPRSRLLCADRCRHQAPPKQRSPSWCFRAPRRCRCSRRRPRDSSRGAASRSSFCRRRTPRSSARGSPQAATRSCTARPIRRWRWPRPKVDAIVVAGGDNGFNHLFVQPDIAELADLRGRTLVADVANTGWSFVLYEILRRHGLERSDYAVQGGRRAVPPLRGDAAGPHHGGGDPQPAVRDPCPARGIEGHGRGGRHHRSVSGHGAIRAARLGAGNTPTRSSPICGLHRRPALVARSGQRAAKPHRIYRERLNVPPDMAAEIYAIASDPVNGLARDASARSAPVSTRCCKLRAAFEGHTLATAERYFDLSCHGRALASL